jgi:protein involved in polysaccharide export with SLBB domain
MIWKGWISALALFVFAATWVGCETANMDKPFVCIDDEIRVGDELTISLLISSDPPADKQFVVRADGTVNLQHLNSVVAAGKKFNQFEKELQAAYIAKMIYREGQVTVIVKPGDRFYTVGGEVNTKGQRIYVGQTTVLRAIVSCGDFTEFANKRKVQITRANGTVEIMDCVKAIKNPKLDRPLCPGDAIFVPRSL